VKTRPGRRRYAAIRSSYPVHVGREAAVAGASGRERRSRRSTADRHAEAAELGTHDGVVQIAATVEGLRKSAVKKTVVQVVGRARIGESIEGGSSFLDQPARWLGCVFMVAVMFPNGKDFWPDQVIRSSYGECYGVSKVCIKRRCPPASMHQRQLRPVADPAAWSTRCRGGCPRCARR